MHIADHTDLERSPDAPLFETILDAIGALLVVLVTPRAEVWENSGVEPSEIYLELYGRLPDLVKAAVDGLTPAQLAQPPSGAVNTIGWLVWHLTRIQDHPISELLEEPQVWERAADNWPARFGGADADPQNPGYGHTAEQVAAIRPASADVLGGYFDTVWSRTAAFLGTLTGADLDRIIDRRWDPPVTLGVRLVSVADDSLQHVGQAAFVRGTIER
jgi:hypothetical protein